VTAPSPIHRLPPEVRVAATLLFVVAVLATPREAVAALGADLAVVLVVAAIGRVEWRYLAGRLVIAVPFFAFALVLPLVGGGERIDVGPLSLSIEGLWGAWNIVAKAAIGVLATSVLAATTDMVAIVAGLHRLRVPAVLVAIAAFMVRYLHVVVDQLRQLQVARVSRGDDPRWLWQARAIATTAGTLFVRSYERGERVHLAMCARGYDGGVPYLGERDMASGATWALGLAPALLAAAIAAIARSTG
jgi:cobalt/nickel transport system permease protein